MMLWRRAEVAETVKLERSSYFLIISCFISLLFIGGDFTRLRSIMIIISATIVPGEFAVAAAFRVCPIAFTAFVLIALLSSAFQNRTSPTGMQPLMPPHSSSV
eukprot:6183800-Pleurochrysis_carterae.AAC.1